MSFHSNLRIHVKHYHDALCFLDEESSLGTTVRKDRFDTFFTQSAQHFWKSKCICYACLHILIMMSHSTLWIEGSVTLKTWLLFLDDIKERGEMLMKI